MCVAAVHCISPQAGFVQEQMTHLKSWQDCLTQDI